MSAKNTLQVPGAIQIGEVRVAEDSDFEKLRQLSVCHDDWNQECKKSTATVWTKSNDVSDFKMIKVRSVFQDISAYTLYDVLHDPHYRKKWDNNMLEAYEICCLNPNNDIGYYAVKTPKPMKCRDFVTQRSWLETGREFFIINHSVNHSSLPPKKGFVRGVSYFTGYYLVPTGKSTDPGCIITYVTQSDPRGKLPSWLVNKITHIMAPKVMSRIHKACRGYDTWKSRHNPNLKPWLFPEQNDLPRLKMEDIKAIQEATSMESLDESGLEEADIHDADLGDDMDDDI